MPPKRARQPLKTKKAREPRRVAPKQYDYRESEEPEFDQDAMFNQVAGVDIPYILSIDIGPRNMGLAVFDMKNNTFPVIKHEDLFPEPEKRSYTAHELAPRQFAHFHAHPEWYNINVWVVELQFIGKTSEKEHRTDNMILQGCLQTLAAMNKVYLVIVSPTEVMKFFNFTSVGHDANKAEAIEIVDTKTALPFETNLIMENHLARIKMKKDFAPKTYKIDVDDQCNALLNALYAAEKITGRAYYEERLKINGQIAS